MSLTRIRALCARLVGKKYQELPSFDPNARAALDAALAECGAERCGESGTPAYEVNNEYFRIGGRKLRVCTEDELFASLWGSRAVVEQVYSRTVEKLRVRGSPGRTGG
jgi:hypothetical protein